MRTRTLPCATVSKCSPRIHVFMSWGCVDPEGEILLYVKRVGEADEFAYYPAMELAGDRITFQLDNLLFSKGVGRYRARMLVAGIEEAQIDIQFIGERKLLGTENANV